MSSERRTTFPRESVGGFLMWSTQQRRQQATQAKNEEYEVLQNLINQINS